MRLLALFLPLTLATSLIADQTRDVPRRNAPPTNKERLEKARKTVLQMFPKSFEEATSTAKKKLLIRELLDNVPRIEDDAEIRYALLVEARELAIAAGQVDLMLEAIELMTTYFRHDAVELKIDALSRLSKATRDAAVHRQLATAALALCKTATSDDRFDDADRLALLALISARKSRSTQLIAQCNAALLNIMAAKKKAR